LPAVTLNLSARDAAQAMQQRTVLELDDAMEKEVIKLLNDRFAKEKPSPDTIPLPNSSGNSNVTPSTNTAIEGMP
jgi:hypothetical protein